MTEDVDGVASDPADCEPVTAAQSKTSALNTQGSGKRDWLADLSVGEAERDRTHLEALDAAIAAGTPVTLSDDRIPEIGDGGPLPVVGIMLGATRIGLLILEDRGETLWICKIGIDADVRSCGYGERAIAFLAAAAAKQRYRRLAGEIERGPADVMERRRRFCRKCGFAVRADDKVDLYLDVPRRMFPRGPVPEGDWTTLPWFTDPQHAERLWEMRYEAAELPQARDALESVYPGPFCRRYLDAVARARGRVPFDVENGVGASSG